MNTLRIVYMGTPEFAVPSLEELHQNGFDIAAVITAPDKPKGRGKKTSESAVKIKAVELGLPILQPTNLKDENFYNQLKSLDANLFIVVAFRMLPEKIWKLPEMGTFNLHASLLPAYRGAAPINWAIINGETETGLTTFFLKHEIDTGTIIYQEKEPIHKDDTVGTLYQRLMERGSKLVLKTVKAIEADTYELREQDGNIKHAPKIFREDCLIDWSMNHEDIRNFVRGLSPYPGAWMKLDGKVCKILSCRVADKKLPVGKLLVEDNQLYIGTSGYAIEILELQLEGKKKMNTASLLNGFSLQGAKIDVS